MTVYRSDLPERPARIARLPIDERGFPVPWFVAWDGGKPDFRVIRPGGVGHCVKHKTCWLCGEPLGRFMTFVVGPMCGVNRVSSEPPSHRDCATYAVQACPFLTRPLAVRDERDMPADAKEPAGVMIKRNPGVALLWVTREYRIFKVENGALFRMGEPTEVEFWSRSRKATLDEVRESVRTGMPLLAEVAEKDGPEGVRALKHEAYRFGQIVATAFGGAG